ncbi:MAG TPA: GntR family transcriptional regulator [Egibacteraceae bacterium]|nr:GntR family transcriptional regulator [Egibacteraceae bacterium]
MRRNPRSDGARLSSLARERLVERIASGELAPGTKLPPEPEFAAELGIARSTLREALRSLEEDGFITRTRGVGTVVTSRTRLTNNLDVNFSVTEAIWAAGHEPGTEAVRIVTRAADEHERQLLRLPEGASVAVIERTRTADGRPVVFSRDALSSDLLLGRPDQLRGLAAESTYELLERRYGLTVHHGIATFRPMKADREVARHLRVTRGALLLYVRQVDYDENGLPLLLSHEYHLAEAFEFTVVRRGPGRRAASPSQ